MTMKEFREQFETELDKFMTGGCKCSIEWYIFADSLKKMAPEKFCIHLMICCGLN